MTNSSIAFVKNQQQEVLHLPFLTVYLNQKARLFECTWHKEDREMKDSELIEHLEEFAKLFSQYQVRGFYVDTRQYHAIMSIEIQEWHDEHIVPKYIEGGVEKIAFVMTKDFMPALTIEQAFDEPQAQKLKTRFFEDEMKAKKWIYA